MNPENQVEVSLILRRGQIFRSNELNNPTSADLSIMISELEKLKLKYLQIQIRNEREQQREVQDEN